MSGITVAMSEGVSGGAGPMPLDEAYVWNGGDTFFVSGASGDLYNDTGGAAYVSGGPTGGTLPYTDSGAQFIFEGSGLAGSLAYGGSPVRIFWSNMAVNEIASGHWQATVTDSASGTASWRHPSAGSIIVKRTS